MKKNKAMIIGFVTPCALTLLIMYLYPVARTIFMSFFAIESVTADVGSWSFYGLGNYGRIFGSATFMTSLSNMLKIWLVGGILVLTIALLFAVILTSGIRFKKFFRAAIYLPNVISAVALATMWIQYVYNQDYGLLNNMLEMVGLEGVKWLGTDMKFWAMLFAFVFGAVGYYMLIFISGIERIPQDLYEAATIDGANKIQQFFRITLPLLKGIIKTNLTFWSINTITFFLWSKMFSPITSEASTIVPVVYLYDTVFGSTGNTERDAGAGAAVGVVLALFVGAVYLITSKLLKDDDLERLRKFIEDHPYVNVLRFTTFFHQFTLMFDELAREKYVEWYGYSASVSPYILEQFEKEAGYPFRAEYIIDQGYYNNQYRIPTKEFQDFQAFQRREVAKIAKEMVDICHECGREAMMFLGDHWIGTEPFMDEFKTIGLDAVVGSVGNGATLRLISDIEGVKYTEGRLLPYFFPDTFHEGGDPVKEAKVNWVTARRAILRKPVDRIGYGGYLKLAVQFPEFVDYVESVCAEFRELYENVKGTTPYCVKRVAVLNCWGRMRA